MLIQLKQLILLLSAPGDHPGEGGEGVPHQALQHLAPSCMAEVVSYQMEGMFTSPYRVLQDEEAPGISYP